MPHRVTRDDALLAAAEHTRGQCAMCMVAGDDQRVVFRGAHGLVALNSFPVRWGHLLVVPQAHVTTFTELDDAVYTELSNMALSAARAIERVLSPARCYVGFFGTSEENLPMTFPHLHAHVVPVEQGARPREVLTWERGVYGGTPAEWRELEDRLRAAW